MRADEYSNMFVLEDRFWWYRGIHDLILCYLRRNSAAFPLRILDAGCGTGKLLSLLSPLGEVTGIDASEAALGYCRERGLTRTSVADLNVWDPGGATYDVITCIDVLCHETVRDLDAVIRTFHESLVPGGLLVLNLPAFESLRRQHDVVVQTVRRLRKEELAPILTGAGFEIELETYRLPILYLGIRVKKALFPDPLDSVEPRSDLRTIPASLDSLLWQMHRLENFAILRGLRLPVGSSLFVVARKSPMSS
jgi:SAM-dependent methyltransferase